MRWRLTQPVMAGVAGVLGMAPAAGAQASDGAAHDEIRSISARVLADSRTRSSLMSDGGAGYDESFFIAGEGDSFRLTAGAVVQFRYQYFRRRSEPNESGFSVSSLRLLFGGHIREDISFLIRMGLTGTRQVPGFAERSIEGAAEVERAYMQFRLDPNWSLRAGVQVFYLTRESEHAPQDQLGVNASPMNSVFGAGSFEGVQLHARYEHVRAWFTFGDGLRSDNTDLGDPGAADAALSFKGDWKIAGEWERFSEFTSFPGSEFAAMLGAGVHWEDGAEVGDPEEDLTLWLFVAELSFEGDGWNVYAALNVARDDFESITERTDLGFVVQGGVFVASRLELFGRFDGVYPDPDRDVDAERFRSIAVGFNHYPFGHTVNAKLSVDVISFLDDVEGSLVQPSDGTGVLAGTRSGDFGVRVQFTLAF